MTLNFYLNKKYIDFLNLYIYESGLKKQVYITLRTLKLFSHALLYNE